MVLYNWLRTQRVGQSGIQKIGDACAVLYNWSRTQGWPERNSVYIVCDGLFGGLL